MDEKQTFTIQTLVATLVLNAILLAVLLFTVQGAQEQLLLILSVGLLITLVLWFIIRTLGVQQLERVAQRTLAATPKAKPEPAKPAPKPEPVKEAPKPAVDTGKLRAQGAKVGAVQMLAILQRQGRLVDFLQEDLSAFADDQIGAAVRSIHEGCKQALDQHVKLEAIYSEAEGSRITVKPGFDPEAVRLTGNVVGEPPFSGELQHRGWRVVTIDLPKRMNDEEKLPVVAAAEVEV